MMRKIALITSVAQGHCQTVTLQSSVNSRRNRRKLVARGRTPTIFLKSHCRRPKALLVSSTTSRAQKMRVLRFSTVQLDHPQIEIQFKVKGHGGSSGNAAQQ